MSCDYVRNIGIIGDGQLAKMLIQAGLSYNVNFYVLPLDNPLESICKTIATLVSSYEELLIKSDIITYEFENIPPIPEHIKISMSKKMLPTLETLEIIRSKISQKTMYEAQNIPVPKTFITGNHTAIKNYIVKHPSIDYVIKSDKGGYNGNGVMVFNSYTTIDDVNKFLNESDLYILEKKIKIKKEIGVIVVVSSSNYYTFAPTEMVFTENNILKYQFSPPNFTPQQIEKYGNAISHHALLAAGCFNSQGVFGIELFIDCNDEIYVNEISPRPHNSGHHTIESNTSSQYDQLMRLLTGRPIFQDSGIEKKSFMANILGSNFTGKYKLNKKVETKLSEYGFMIHDYGKFLNKPNRKMGHLTITFDQSTDIDFENCYNLINGLQLIEPDEPQNDVNFTKKTPNHQNNDIIPVVGVVMGSISDLPVVTPALDILKEFNIPYCVNVVSAHRMPDHMFRYAEESKYNGLKVIIACAGGAAHLPGMIASKTHIPVIGLPAMSSSLNGLDSLYSIVQMPKGIPVATVAIGNGVNAALLACRMLAISDYAVKLKLEEYQKYMEKTAITSNTEMHNILDAHHT